MLAEYLSPDEESAAAPDIQHHRIRPRGVGLAVVVVAILLSAFNTLVVGLRIYIRGWYLRSSRIWGWDDTLAVLGFMFYLTICVFSTLCAYHGIGVRNDGLEKADASLALQYYYYFQVTYCLAVAFIKSSLCVGLSRLTNQRHYRTVLWFLVASWVVCGIARMVCALSLCRPAAAAGREDLGVCRDGVIIAATTYAFTAWAIATDITCAIIPWLLLRNLQIANRTKYSLMGIMGTCVVASVGSAMVIPYVWVYAAPRSESPDRLYWYAYILVWTLVESGFGLAASSIPPLGKLIPLFNHPPTKGFRLSGEAARAQANAATQDTELFTLNSHTTPTSGSARADDGAVGA